MDKPTQYDRIAAVVNQLPHLIEITHDDHDYLPHDSIVGEMKLRGLKLEGSWFQRERAIRDALKSIGLSRQRRPRKIGSLYWYGVRWSRQK